MKPFLLKLFAPRPTFHLDITEDEMAVMRVHGQYWRELLDKGIAVVFGPVLEPKESWGVAIFYAEDQAAAEAIAAEDPASKAGIREEVYPMASVVHT
ncbi:MAG TPA: YciI family protein [Candidatus Baltobacteraceae bacterium]|nr:YciI family protein [Candidatus Baltobacteraceae bacterium]